MKKILLVKTSSMGDVVHNLATVSDIKRKLPESSIDWVVEQAFADIPSLHPGVNRVIPVRLRHWRKNPLSATNRAEIRLVKQHLIDAAYDCVIDTQGLIKSALVARWAGVPVSGYRWGSARESLATLFYRHRYPVSREQHAVDRNRQLVAAALGYTLDELPLDYGIAGTPGEFVLPGLKDDYVVCLHGTSRASKLWSESSWEELLPVLASMGLQPILAWGNEQERLRSERLAASSGAVMVAPVLDLKSLAGLLRGSRAVVGVDTGPVHLAAAGGCKVVAIYTDTDPQRTGAVAADPEKVINLGNINAAPSAEEVVAALRQLDIA